MNGFPSQVGSSSSPLVPGQPMGITLSQFDLLQLAESHTVRAQTEPRACERQALIRQAIALQEMALRCDYRSPAEGPRFAALLYEARP